MRRPALLGMYTYLEFFLVLLALLPIMGAVTLFTRGDPTRRLRGRWMRNIGKFSSALTPLWRFSVSGTPPPDILKRGYVVVSNHESTADPFLLSWLPWDMRWISKEELYRPPFIGWAMRLSGDIPLRRGSGESVRAMFAECRKTLEGGVPVMIFPEGTRSQDGSLLPFKDGAFQLAIETGVPVLPVALAGTRQCLPKGSRWFGDARAEVRILEPVSTEGMTLEDVPRLRELVRSHIASASVALRNELNIDAVPVAAASSNVASA